MPRPRGPPQSRIPSSSLHQETPINNHGAGFADHVEVEDGLTVAGFFTEKMPGGKAGDYLIRVNRLPTPADQVLQSGDRISITPTKIEGASA